MATVTIKGKEYVLGDIAGTEENFEIIGALMSVDRAKVDMSVLLPGARRVLVESITAGSGAEAAAKAMADLPMKLGKSSELWPACNALVEFICE